MFGKTVYNHSSSFSLILRYNYIPSKSTLNTGVDSAKTALLNAYRRAEANLWTWCEPVAKIGFSGVVKVGSCGVSAVVLKEGNDKPHSVVVGIIVHLGDHLGMERKGVC